MAEIVLSELVRNFKHAVMISGFVFLMMMAIEYVNVQTKGLWQKALQGSPWKQLLFSALLGAIPGCLGAFTVVSFFSHGLVSIGAVVAAMIATSGDEAFVMLSLFPQEALYLTLLLFVIGVVAGYFTDKFYKPVKILAGLRENKFPLHDEPNCKCYENQAFINQWKQPSVYRLLLLAIVLLLLAAILFGYLAVNAKMWVKITLLATISFSLFVTITVPDHFLKSHLWEHVVLKHMPRIFAWTFGTLFVFGLMLHFFDVSSWLTDNMIWVLLVAVLLGVIPESGPHLVFVTMFFEGSIPFSILLASSISQDGHGMLPMLAESERGFFVVKLINIGVALLIGFVAFYAGF